MKHLLLLCCMILSFNLFASDDFDRLPSTEKFAMMVELISAPELHDEYPFPGEDETIASLAADHLEYVASGSPSEQIHTSTIRCNGSLNKGFDCKVYQVGYWSIKGPLIFKLSIEGRLVRDKSGVWSVDGKVTHSYSEL